MKVNLWYCNRSKWLYDIFTWHDSMQWIDLCGVLRCDEGKHTCQNNIFKISKNGVVKSFNFLKH